MFTSSPFISMKLVLSGYADYLQMIKSLLLKSRLRRLTNTLVYQQCYSYGRKATESTYENDVEKIKWTTPLKSRE
jgi:spore maturation protein CgeB